MKPVDIDSPIRLDRPFWVIYALIGLPSLFWIRTLFFDLPLITRIAGAILLPFLIAIVVYTSAMVIAAVLFGGPTQRRKFWAFLATMGIVSVAFWVKWAHSGFKDSSWATPAIGSCTAIMLYGAISRLGSNQSTDPTPSSGTPPAEQDSRLP